MVNKPHAPRGANKAGKKPAATTMNGEDSSFIVFGNDNDKPKKNKKPADSSNATTAIGGSKGKAAAGTSGASAEPEQKKPDTRTLIGGASWTGKLPQTMFNEHCQKQKWEKPEYTMRGSSKTGFTGGVIIKQKNPKTQEITTLPPIVPPSDYLKERGTQESAVEARHFAAAYALFRVSNMKNIHMMLPPTYRDLWKGDFQDLKSAAIAQGQGYLYEADPFLAKKQHDEAIVAREKTRADKAKQQVEDKKLEVVSLDGQVQSKHVLKGWMRVPKVEMGVKTRREVERQIRRGGAWNLHAVQMTMNQRKMVVDDLSNIGFRRSHVEEAAEVCKDREECLEWLLIHVPEDDLPKWCLPDNYLAGVSMASGDLKREGQIKRLAATGYSPELCADMLELNKGDEGRAAEALQARLLGQSSTTTSDAISDHEIWDEELATSEAIFGDRFTNHERICTIVLELQTSSKQPIVVRARPPSGGYPNTLPLLAIEAALPAYVRLAILKQVLVAASSDFLGVQMLFSIVDWLEQNIPAIIEKPGKLSEVASATATSTIEASRPVAKKPRRQPKPISWSPESPSSQRIREEWSARQSSAEQQKMLTARKNLPAWSLQDEIVQSVTMNQVTIISGETGSGKSTQSVQFILDDLIKRCFGDQANIICTQPRRISALGLADRVADERCVKVGDEIGYAIRGESRKKQGVTKITFVTTGVLLRRLQTSGGSTDDVVRSLADVSHVIIDEVHERSLDTDFLLVLLRDVLKKRKDLRLVLMSATLDAQTFESYFSSSSSVGKVEIEGRTHPVTDIYLDDIVRLTGFGAAPVHEDSPAELSLDDQTPDGSGYNTPRSDTPSLGNALRAVGTRINYDLIARTVELIDRKLGHADGGILIFLPGVAEIDQTLRALRAVPNLHTLPLHASLQSVEQRRVFPRAPQGLRKVIAATNVAETSITIEDIVAVIDTGRVKETSFDPANNMVKLAEVWASRAACKQRRGRAGRVRAGECYKLYTRSAEAKMAERPDPEIRRVPLEQLCLSVRAMGVSDVPAFLASALTPPESLAVEGALKLLSRMGALDSTDLTALGRHLSMIPADLRCGKLMVYGAAFGCLDATITIAAILTVKSPFVSPKDKREESKAARSSFGRGQGDLLCDHSAYEEWYSRRAAGEPTSSLRRWCDENFLNHQTLLDISTNRVQYLASLQETGFLPPDYRPGSRASQIYNQHNNSEVLLRALIAGAFQPQVARIDFPDKKYAASSSGAVEVDPEARTIKYFNEGNGRVFVHPSSTLFDAQSFPGNSVYMSYFTKMATSKVFIRDLTPFNVYALLMFGGKIEIDPQGRGLLVDNWVRLRGWARIGVLVSRMRMMLEELLGKKLDDPALEMGEHDVVKAVRKMIELDGLDR
ncbi:putative ATP-dependent RNA helicase ucp12 [Pseudocercospora fuligena]|uniref:RNA helicase n=1 Tax=Pseudocercospora fuligena TaxID=685502 RepID=A0A8H6R6Y3_9PEZI|nr:putative ATP-dependent RNA helicase ucp12 [Pseudocercospora fuligena]